MQATSPEPVSLNLEKWRLFVAVFPPETAVERLLEAVRPLRAGISPRAVGWTMPDQIHLTLHFLGSIEAGKISDFEAVSAMACDATGQFSLRVRGLGCFPGLTRPRVLWAGLGGTVEQLESLARRMEPGFQKLGYIPETRPFHPHLTLGRVKGLDGGDRQRFARALGNYRDTDFGEWTVDRVELMRSVLTSAGARYSVVRTFALK